MRKSKVITWLETIVLGVGTQKGRQLEADLVQNVESLGPLVDPNNVLRTVGEYTYLVLLDQKLNKVNKPLEDHPHLIEK